MRAYCLKRFITDNSMRLKKLAALLLTTSLLTACDSLFGSDVRFAENARVIITNEGSTPLLLITSTQFVLTTNLLTGQQNAEISRADTTRINGASADQTFHIDGKDRFFAGVFNPDTTRTATVHFRVQLDDREVFNQRATLRGASLQYANYFR